MEEAPTCHVQGRKVSFKNTIIILTSNLGSSYILDMGQKDPDSVKDMVMSIVRPTTAPSLVQTVVLPYKEPANRDGATGMLRCLCCAHSANAHRHGPPVHSAQRKSHG